MEVVIKVFDQLLYNRLRLSSMSSMKSIGNVFSSSELDFNGLEGEEKEGVLFVLLLLLYVFLVVDKDISGSGLVIVGIVRFFCIMRFVVVLLLFL